jgi:hypothetical protein
MLSPFRDNQVLQRKHIAKPPPGHQVQQPRLAARNPAEFINGFVSGSALNADVQVCMGETVQVRNIDAPFDPPTNADRPTVVP